MSNNADAVAALTHQLGLQLRLNGMLLSLMVGTGQLTKEQATMVIDDVTKFRRQYDQETDRKFDLIWRQLRAEFQ